MDEIKGNTESPEAAAFQGGNRVASITPQGQALNGSISEKDRVTAVETREGAVGQTWQDDAESVPDDDRIGGFGTVPSDRFPADRPHEGGDPLLDGDAQYGASPLRPARYAEDHEANLEIAAGQGRSGHHGAQARYPKPTDPAPKTTTGHDEQAESRRLRDEGR